MKRIKDGKGVYQINTVVDANNLVSVVSLRSVGSYDLSTITGDIVFRPGKPGEMYPATKKRPLKLEKLPVLCDDNGPFGSPTSDSERALITEQTTDIMTVIFGFDGVEGLNENMQMMTELLVKYAEAKPDQVQSMIVQDQPVQLPVFSPNTAVSITSVSHFKPTQEAPQPPADTPHPSMM